MIESRGGTHKEQYGVDGTIDGKPVEVRLAKKDDRFRLNEETHDDLLEGDGFYLFDKIGDGKPAKKVPADEVGDKVGNVQNDRGYEYRFVDVDDIF